MAPQTVVPRSSISFDAHKSASLALAKDSLGLTCQEHPWEIDNRLNLSTEELAQACILLDLGRHQQLFAASPFLSGFAVGSSAYFGLHKVALGANHEFGAGVNSAYDEGVHSEATVVVNAISRFGKDTRLEMIAITTDAVSPTSSCGKCRSIIETYGKKDPIIVSAGRDCRATMWKLSELLPWNFEKVDLTNARPDHAQMLPQLYDALARASAVSFTHFSERSIGKSLAAIVADGNVFSFPRIDSLAFYGTSSLRATIAAVIQAQSRHLDAVLLTSRSGLPVGEDRQLLFECASFFDKAETLPVYLHAEGSKDLHITTPAALLPYAFGPKDLGISLKRP